MFTTIREALSPDKPHDLHDRFFWLLDRINSHRRYAWEPEFYEDDIRELGMVAGELYTDWLKTQGLRQEAECYDYLVLPYISFRFLSAPKRKEVDLFTVSPAQRKRFIELVVDDMQPVPDVRFFRAMVGESFKMLFSFLSTLQRRREQ